MKADFKVYFILVDIYVSVHLLYSLQYLLRNYTIVDAICLIAGSLRTRMDAGSTLSRYTGCIQSRPS